MLPSAIRDRLLVDEGQLGQRLNRDLQYGDRADFRLYLALISEAVEDQPWFDGQPANDNGNRDWRAYFSLRPPASLVAEAQEDGSVALNEQLQQGGGMLDVQLWLALKAPPLLASRPKIDPVVYDNLSPLVRERLQKEWRSVERQEDPLVLLPVLEQVHQGVDTRLHWFSSQL
ncbi:VC2046/SO_2500 family protein [Aeromonas cavernicola]|uniref:Uncharacterized protein n=1 Tax=Aeromonas cavernicola TaxID=1006623 RepID=A0A2H9U0L1_9GAMM|nr:VC2046/SO_2500 family protein [Aeromonas cavernicola]PJG57582.1 hypothetical protein CUC53_17225 [Aeromonas cavernicola]